MTQKSLLNFFNFRKNRYICLYVLHFLLRYPVWSRFSEFCIRRSWQCACWFLYNQQVTVGLPGLSATVYQSLPIQVQVNSTSFFRIGITEWQDFIPKNSRQGKLVLYYMTIAPVSSCSLEKRSAVPFFKPSRFTLVVGTIIKIPGLSAPQKSGQTIWSIFHGNPCTTQDSDTSHQSYRQT